MVTLADLKAAEVKLRGSLRTESTREFKPDIQWAYRFTRIRRKKMERKLGIGVMFLCVCLMGCEPPAETSSHPGDSSAGVETMDANISGYCALECCCQNYADGVTANGYRIQPGAHFVAADKRFPFGTLISVPGYNNGKPVPVLDRGGKIKGNCIDLFFSDKDGVSGHQRALTWGRQYLTVKVERVKQ